MLKKSLLIMLLMAIFAPWAAGQKSLPYDYGFENNDLATEGWFVSKTGSNSSYPTGISTSSKHEGNYGFQFAYPDHPNYLISPEFIGSTNGTTIEFYYKSSSSSYPDSFKVGYSTTTNETTAFEWISTITDAPTDWTKFEYDLPTGAKFIAVNHTSDGFYLYLDDFHFEAVSSCPKPTELTATNVTNNSATLGWTSDADSWNLQYKAANDDDWTLVNGVTNPYTLNSVLSEKTTYTFQVQPVCSGTPGNYSNTATFTTTCNPKDLTYTMGFEDSEATEFADWNIVSSSSYTGRNTSAKKTGSYGFRFIYNTSTQNLITPPLNATTGVSVEFWYKNSSSSYSAPSFKVAYSTTTSDFDWDNAELVTSSTDWQLYSKTFAADVKHVAIQYQPVASNNYSYLYIDDIILEAPAACEKPSGLTATANAEDPIHKADLAWTAGGEETSWDIIYNAGADFDPTTQGTLVADVSNNPYTLGNLTGGVTYYAYVRGHCPNGSDVSNWSTVACQFNTQNGCDTPTSLTATAIPGGAEISWSDGENTPASWELCYGTSATQSNANNTTIPVNANPYTLSDLEYSKGYYYWVRTICAENDGTSEWSSRGNFTTLAACPTPKNLQASATPDGAVVTWETGYEEEAWQLRWRQYISGTGYTEYTIIGEDEPLTTTTYTLTGLESSQSSYVSVRAYCDAEHQSDWIEKSFTTLASCPKPTNLTYTDLTANSVVLDWTIGYDETAWNIQYKANGAADWTLIESITDKPYTMTVEDATTYQVQIQNACGSDWSNTITFTTPCLPNTTFPFTEDFEGLTADKDIPNCWNNATGNTSDSYKWGYKTGSGNGSTVTNGHNGTKCIRFESYYNTAGNYNDLKTPVMNFPAGKTMVLGFWWKNPAGGDFSVYISTDGGATYATALKSGMTGQSEWKEEEIELTDYVGAENVVVVFKGTSNCGSGNAFIYLDDVTISEKSDCAKPKDLAVSSFDNHSATLSWDANGSTSPWEVAYSTTENFDLNDATAYSIAEATTNPFTLSGLTNFTTYYVRVRTKCGESTYSDWNNNGYQTFTTTATYTAPTNVTFSNVGDTEATISWTKGNSEEDNTDYTVWYKTGDTELTQDVENATSVTLTNLNAGSNYEVKVRAKKGDDFSAWSSSVNFQTEFCAPANQCNIHFEFTDSANDGWNGSYIKVVYKATNIDIAHLTFASGSSYSGDLALCNGSEYDFVWVKGSYYDYECGFTIRDVNNEIILEHASGTAPTDGATLLTYTMDCTVATCARPSGLTADAVYPYSAELSWTEGDDTQTAWQIAYSTSTFDPNAENFDLSTVTVENATAIPFTLRILDANTTYYAYVRAVCGENDFSKWSADECEFTTQSSCPAPTNVHLLSRPASHQLAIAWTPGYEETNWNFYYRVAGTEWGDPIAVTSPAYTIVDGELSTTYEVKVAAVCGDEEGGVSDILTISTPINVTINAQFSEGFNQSGCPSGWTAVSGVHNSYTYSWTFGGTFASSANYSEMYLVTPLLHLSDLTPILSFAQKRSSGNATSANIYVKVSTTGIEKTDFSNTIWTSTTGNLTTSNKTTTIDLSAFNGQDVYIAFFYDGTGGHYWHIDDVNVSIANTFRTAGNWNVAENWSEKVPGSEDNAIIAADATVPSGVVAKANNITIAEGGSLTIADGGQLVHNNAGVQATVQKHIAKHGENDGWYFISSSVATNVTPSVENGIIASTSTKYDLYFYDEPAHYWRNYKEGGSNSGFAIEPLKGYLYANGEDNGTTLSFTGTLQPGNVNVEKALTFNTEEGAVLAGWNLVGNPFTFNAILDKPCYTISGNAINTDPHTAGTYTVAPCEGVMVLATGTNETVTFSKATQEAPQPNQLQMTVAQQVMTRGIATSTVNDKAIVNFNMGSQLEKFVFNADAAKLYIPQNGKDYAIVSAEGQGEIPVNFKAASDGQYTLTVNPEGVEMNYLHLIDNMTGADVDLLASPNYTFNATTHDYESRFRLVFASNSGDANGDNETFAFFSNGNWIISNEGEATLQVVDMMGRVLSSERVNGSVSKAINASAGVYLLRLVNGNDVKTQKVVVR